MKMRRCNELACRAEIVFLQSQNDPHRKVPVDPDSLSEDDLAALERGEDVVYRPGEHVSHFKTCKNPGRFSKGARK